jgi:hypothetical protein
MMVAGLFLASVVFVWLGRFHVSCRRKSREDRRRSMLLVIIWACAAALSQVCAGGVFIHDMPGTPSAVSTFSSLGMLGLLTFVLAFTLAQRTVRD